MSSTTRHPGTVRLGVVGYGNQGSIYARALSRAEVPGMVLGAIADVDPARRVAAGQDHPGVPTYADGLELIRSEDVDAVVTTLPHFQHAEIGLAALDHGLHVLVEKPVGVHVEQAQDLVDRASERPDLVFAVMFNQRTNPLYQKVREIVAGGEIGEIRRSTWVITTWWRPQGYYDSSAWRATWGGEGGGVLVNQAPHQLDLWQWICGMPDEVVARLGNGVGRDIAVENEVAVLASYANGATGQFVTATNDLVGTDRFEIVGTRGRVVVTDSARATVSRLADDEEAISARFDVAASRRLFAGEVDLTELWTTEELTFESAWGSQHNAVLANFAASVLRGEPLIAPGADGLAGVRLANAIHYSGWTGRWVPTSLDPDEFLAALNVQIRDEGRFPEQVPGSQGVALDGARR